MSPRVCDGPDVPKDACQTRHPSHRHEVHNQVSRRRVASDARNRRPRTSKQEGSIPKSDLWITAGSGVGALFFFELDPTETERYKGQDRGRQTPTQKRPGPDPKRQPQAGDRNRTPKTRSRKRGGPTGNKFRNLMRFAFGYGNLGVHASRFSAVLIHENIFPSKPRQTRHPSHRSSR